jgi:hypothetical protein
MATIHQSFGLSGGISANTSKELEPPTVVINKNVFLLQDQIQELIPTLSVVKKTMLESLDTVLPDIDSTTVDLTTDYQIRGQHLRANLRNVF